MIALGGNNDEDAAETQSTIDVAVKLLSVETVNILQLVGFNFREAIGGPLTDLLARLIKGLGPVSTSEVLHLQELHAERDIEGMRLALDSNATNRYRKTRDTG